MVENKLAAIRSKLVTDRITLTIPFRLLELMEPI